MPSITLTSERDIQRFFLILQDEDPTRVDITIIERAYAGSVPYEIPVEVKNHDLSLPLDPEFWEAYWLGASEDAWTAAGFTVL